jgi:MATE family multidrug resistance protein
MIYLGLSNAATVKIGRAHGEGDGSGLRAVALTAVGLTALLSGSIAILFFAAPTPLVGLFLDERQTDVAAILSFGTTLLAGAALFQLFDAMQVVALGLLRGVQDARMPMLIAAVSYWLVGIPVSYGLAFPLGWGGIGIWAGLVTGLAAAAALLMARFWRRDWLDARAQSSLGPA